MIDIRKQQPIIDCINMVLTSGHSALIKRERDQIVVVGIEENRKVVGKSDIKSVKA